MKLTILGSGGCIPIPKPFCQCHVCLEAREKGVPFARLGSAAFLHNVNVLIDTMCIISAYGCIYRVTLVFTQTI